MRNAIRREVHSHSLLDTLRARIAEYLYHEFARADGLLGNLDRWTRRQIIDENLAKAVLVLDADEPAEACYRDLVREVDTEAQMGIYLARQGLEQEHLHCVCDETGVSGELHSHIDTIAPLEFADETLRSDAEFDLVWVTIEATHDRAHLDARVSEIIASFLMDDADSVRDMSGVMRALMYTAHEDAVRKRCGLPSLLNDAESRDLQIMVTELTERGGDYNERIEEIRHQADRLHRSP